MSEKIEKQKKLTNIKAIIFDMQDTLYSNGRLYPDTILFLSKLKKQGYFLAVLSNAPSTVIKDKLDLFKLSDFFDCIVSADEYSTKKPDPMLIGVTIVLLSDACGVKLDKSECIFIGDKPSADIRCAKLGGILSIRILRGLYATKIPDDEYEIPDFEFKNFKDAELLFY